jgi:hypothetical protein
MGAGDRSCDFNERVDLHRQCKAAAYHEAVGPWRTIQGYSTKARLGRYATKARLDLAELFTRSGDRIGVLLRVQMNVRDKMLPSIRGRRYFVSNDLRPDDLACLILRVLEKLAPCSKASLVATTGESAAGQTILQALLRLEALALIRVAEHEIVITDSGKRFLDDLNSSQSSPRTSVTETASPRGLTRQLVRLAKICHERAATWIVYVWGGGRSATAQPGRLRLKPALAGRNSLLVGAFFVLVLFIGGRFALLPSEGVENSRGEPFVLDGTEDSRSPMAKAEPGPPMIHPRENIRVAIIDQLSKPTAVRESHKREQEALVEHYSVPTRPLLWVDENGVTDRARFVIKEIAKADEYGLRATDYEVPEPDGFARDVRNAAAWLADAEIKIDLAVLRYTRDSAGGRINPGRLSKNLGPGLLPDPPEVLKSIALESDPVAYLRSLQPRHPQFEHRARSCCR